MTAGLLRLIIQPNISISFIPHFVPCFIENKEIYLKEILYNETLEKYWENIMI